MDGQNIRADRDFEMGPATEMMVNDFDDERTLDEEEALEGSEDSHNELSNLQKEGDMPLKDLLAMYGYGDPSTENSNSSDQMILPSGGIDPEGESRYSDKGDNDADDDDDDDEADTVSNEPDLKQFYTEMLVKGKDCPSSTPGSTTKRKNSAGTGNSTVNRRRRNNNENNDDEDDDDEEDDEDEEEGECNMIDGNGNTGATSSSRGNNASTCVGGSHGSVSGHAAATGNCDAADGAGNNGSGVAGNRGDGNETVEDVTASSGPVDVPEDGVVGGGGGSGTSRLLRSVSRPQSEEEEDDCDYSPDEEEWKKTIMVGSDYQAAIPEGLCRYDDALPYENEDKMLWDPSHIPEEETEEFLERAQLPAVKGGSLPAGSHVRDDEQALYLLLQCGYNLEEALRRRRMNVIPPTDAVSLWSEEECHNFESGLRTYGKDFHLIQKNKVRTRSVGELVQFYYLWKKTERHDIFTYKARLEKKKYALHPGITDYMDRFLEEQEGVRDRSSSPNVHYLLYGDAKRQRTSGVTNNDEMKSESWDGSNAVDPLADVNGPTNVTPSLAPPLPPPPPGPPTSASGGGLSSNVVVNSNSSSGAPLLHTECSTTDSNCGNSSIWLAVPSRTQSSTSSSGAGGGITATNMALDPAAVIENNNSASTPTAVLIASSATTPSDNDLCHQRTASRSGDSARHDSPSPENILPHMPP